MAVLVTRNDPKRYSSDFLIENSMQNWFVALVPCTVQRLQAPIWHSLIYTRTEFTSKIMPYAAVAIKMPLKLCSLYAHNSAGQYVRAEFSLWNWEPSLSIYSRAPNTQNGSIQPNDTHLQTQAHIHRVVIEKTKRGKRRVHGKLTMNGMRTSECVCDVCAWRPYA